jgi:multimeric flavodoxin WrbA
MIIAGLVGSGRKMGNSELLVKEVLQHADRRGHGVKLIRLPELTIKPCNGCLQCIFMKRSCHIDDDMPFLLEELSSSDALVIAAPTYVLGPAGIIKMIVDRIFMTSHGARAIFQGKPAAIIAVAGLRGWEPYALPGSALLPLSLGFVVVDSLIAYAPGPGEVLLDVPLLERARRMADILAAQGSDVPRESGERPSCPLCRGTFFTILDEGSYECPTCALKGFLSRSETGEWAFIPYDPDAHRWEARAMEDHINGWIKSTGGRFKNHVKEIAGLRKSYRKLDDRWKVPASRAPQGNHEGI